MVGLPAGQRRRGLKFLRDNGEVANVLGGSVERWLTCLALGGSMERWLKLLRDSGEVARDPAVMQKNCCCDDYFHRQCHIRCSAVGWQDGSEGEGTCCPA